MKWTVEGANWIWKYNGKLKDAMEVATLCVEDFMSDKQEFQLRGEFLNKNGDKRSQNSNDSLGLGCVILLTNPQLIKIEDSIVIYTPHVLANAGFYDEAEKMTRAMKKAKF